MVKDVHSVLVVFIFRFIMRSYSFPTPIDDWENASVDITVFLFQIPLKSRDVRKRTFGYLLPAKIQISPRIGAIIWSESSWGAFWIVKFLHAENETPPTRLCGCAGWFEFSLGAPWYQLERFLTVFQVSKQILQVKNTSGWEIIPKCTGYHNKYTRLLLSRLRLSRITAYLEVKIWSLF